MNLKKVGVKFLAMIYNIIISPFETVIDWIFCFIRNWFPKTDVMGAIIGVSLGLNLLALPLYSIADKIQEEERNAYKQLEKWSRHIKSTFKGDEQFMMLSEFYRQNNYHPVYALRNILPVLIQVPFFIAAYHYLKNNDALGEAKFWIFKNLGAPDALYHGLNILPIVMTLINWLSVAVYVKGLPFREKMQGYILAIVFLVLLYNAPSGLVLYWILNNAFSLGKNLLKKDKCRQVFCLILSFSGLVLFYAHYMIRDGFSSKRLLLFAGIYLFGLLPILILFIFKSKILFFQYLKEKYIGLFNVCMKIKKIVVHTFSSNFEGFLSAGWAILILSGFGLSLLCGLVLPAGTIASSPIEFSFLGTIASPLSYVLSSFCICFGFFVFWPFMFYMLFGKKVKTILPLFSLSIFICALFNVYVFKHDYGTLDISFTLKNPAVLNQINVLFIMLPVEIFLFSGIICLLLLKFNKQVVIYLLILSLCFGEASFGGLNVLKIIKEYKAYVLNLEKYGNKEDDENIKPVYHLSKTGKNVLVLFLDRGLGPIVEDIFDEFPEIKRKFDGFTWYPNTLSFSNATLYGAPPLYGGYEYTEEEINKRNEEFLRDKNTESQLVCAKLFADAGFSVTMTDPVFPNYSYKGDLRNYVDYERITVKEIEGDYYDDFLKEKGLEDYKKSDFVCRKQIINFSFLQILYPKFREFFYSHFYKLIRDISPLDDGSKKWIKAFSNLYFLPVLTDFDSKNDSFVSIHSMATHDIDSVTIGNDFESVEPYADEDRILKHYKGNIAAFKQLGKFFDFLREYGVYNNTRIIIVSDHGTWGVEFKQFDGSALKGLREYYSAMLLYKDFDSNDTIKRDDAFMTNADTLFLAKDCLYLSDKNPFTGKVLEQSKEQGVNIYGVIEYKPDRCFNLTEFPLDKENAAWHVSENIYNESNWIPLLEWEKTHGGSQ